MLPSHLRQFTQSVQFGKLGFIIGIGGATGAQAIAQAKGHVIQLHNVANVFKVLVQEAFAVVGHAPFRHDGAATRDNAGAAVGREVWIWPKRIRRGWQSGLRPNPIASSE